MAAACAPCVLGALAPQYLTYPGPVQQVVVIEHPFVFVANGTTISSTSTQLPPGATAGGNDVEILWSTLGTTLTYPSTYAHFTGFTGAAVTPAPTAQCAETLSPTTLTLPSTTDPASFIFNVAGQTGLPSQLISNLNNIPGVAAQLSASNLAVCDVGSVASAAFTPFAHFAILDASSVANSSATPGVTSGSMTGTAPGSNSFALPTNASTPSAGPTLTAVSASSSTNSTTSTTSSGTSASSTPSSSSSSSPPSNASSSTPVVITSTTTTTGSPGTSTSSTTISTPVVTTSTSTAISTVPSTVTQLVTATGVPPLITSTSTLTATIVTTTGTPPSTSSVSTTSSASTSTFFLIPETISTVSSTTSTAIATLVSDVTSGVTTSVTTTVVPSQNTSIVLSSTLSSSIPFPNATIPILPSTAVSFTPIPTISPEQSGSNAKPRMSLVLAWYSVVFGIIMSCLL